MSTEIIPPDDMETDTDDRHARAEEVRKAWIRAVREFKLRRTGIPCTYKTKPRWDGGYDADARRFYKNPIWPKVVTEADELGVSPLELIDVLFASLTGDTAPLPTELISTNNIRRVKRRDEERVVQVIAAAAAQRNVFRSAMWAAGRSVLDPNPKAPVRHVINDLSEPLDPLFRYAVAVLAELPDLAEQWRERAQMQFDQSPDLYAQHWKHLLPPHMTAGRSQNNTPQVLRG